MSRTIRRNLGIILTIVTLALTGSAALATVPAATLGYGDFLLLYAEASQITLPANATPQTALAVLQAAGLLPAGAPALDRPLTQGDVVRIGRAAGIKVTSRSPGKTLDRVAAEVFLDIYVNGRSPAGGSQDRVAADSSAPDHANLEKGKKKGRPFQSSPEPDPAN
jgi:hypothetical protein